MNYLLRVLSSLPGGYLRVSASFVLCVTAPLSAQERKSPVFLWLESTGKTIIATFDRPLHPLLGSVAPGGGVGTGLGFETASRPWSIALEGLYTARRYWSAEATLDYTRERANAVVYGRVRDMPKLDFFGPGSTSTETDRTSFALREGVAGVAGSVDVTPWLSVGARVEQLWPEVDGGRSSNVPSIETRFGETEAPGLTTQPTFGRYEGSVELLVPAAPGIAFQQGGNYRLTYGGYDDQELGRFSFRRLEIEGQHRFAPFRNLQRLTLHGWLSVSEVGAGQEVPFYLRRTLGGTGDLRSVREELVGSDGTQATLRSFSYYRFRDRNLVLLQAEYRIPVWGPIDMTFFAEGGKVGALRSDLDLSDLARSFGGSLSLMRGRTTAARVDIGLGDEGPRFFLTIGRDFKP